MKRFIRVMLATLTLIVCHSLLGALTSHSKERFQTVGNQAIVPDADPIEPHNNFVTFTLVRGGKFAVDYATYEERTVALAKVLAETPFDDIAFHEGNVPANIILDFQNRHNNVRFVNAQDYGGFRLPPGVKLRTIRGSEQYSLGYEHMCRFFAMKW